jgi:hypothetical protein
MAEQLKLVRGYDGAADVSSVSLIDDTDGFKPAYDGWTPKSKPDKNGRVQEALTLRVQGTATDDIAASLGLIADKSREAAQYFSDSAERYAVWFRVQLDGETGARQSLVYQLDHAPGSSVYDVPFRVDHHLNQYVVGIERGAWWENTEAGTITGGNTSCLGGTLAYAAIGGDLPARIGKLRINAVTGLLVGGTVIGVFPNGDFWMGARSNRFGVASAFTPYRPLATSWVAGGGTALADAQCKSGTALAWGPYSGGDRVFVGGCSTGGTTQYGEHLVLMRAKLTGSGGAATVQMALGLAADKTGSGTAIAYNNAALFPRAYLSAGTVYKFYEMGVVTLTERPPVDTLALYAQTLGGTPALYVDGLYLIPTEAMVRTSGRTSNYELQSLGIDMLAYQSPDGRAIAYCDGKDAPATAVNSPTFTGGLPPGDSGILVICAQNADFADVSLFVDPQEIVYYERWKEARGND